MARIKAAILAFTSSFNQQLYTLRLARIKVILPPAILVTTQTSIKSYVWSTILHTQIGHVHWPESRRSYHQQFWHSQRFPRQSNLMIFVLPLLEAIINHISSLYSVHNNYYSVHTTIIYISSFYSVYKTVHTTIIHISLFCFVTNTIHISSFLFCSHNYYSYFIILLFCSHNYYSYFIILLNDSSELWESIFDSPQ